MSACCPDVHRMHPLTHLPSEPEAKPALTVSAFGPDASVEGFDALAEEWNALLARSSSNTIFLTHEWQTNWWRCLGKGELWILAFRTVEEDELVAIAPLFLVEERDSDRDSGSAGRRHFHLVGCIEVSDYLDLIVAQGWERVVYTALLKWLDGPDAPAWDGLDLCNLPEGSLTYQVLPEIFERAGYTVTVMQEDVAPHFLLPTRYERYLQEQVDKKQRHEIRRKQRRAEREATVGFHIVGPQDKLAEEVDDFIALQRASATDKAAFMTPEMERFFHSLATTMTDAGYLRLCFLTLDGEKAATLYAFDYNHEFLLYNSGYDPEAHAHLSPGWVILSYAIQYAIVTGCVKFDFMQGDEEYKYRFGSRDDRVMRTIVRR